MDKIIIVGGFIEIIEMCEEDNINIEGIFDNCNQQQMHSYKVFGNDHDAKNLYNELKKYSLIITPDLPNTRKKLKLLYEDYGYIFSSLISSRAKISKSASIGNGTIIQSGTNISSEVIIGDFVKVNCSANIMHNSTVGDFSTVAPNAVILGHVNIGIGCYIGSNATILPNINICDNVTIGAGAVVTRSIAESGSVYAGVPAVKIK